MKAYISHTAKDKAIADALVSELNSRNIGTVPHVRILPESSGEKQARSPLSKADVIVAILSKHSFSSQWVRMEIDEALFNEKFKNSFLPVLLYENSEDLSLLPWVLQKIQHLRLSAKRSPTFLAKKIADRLQTLKSGGQ